MYAKNSEIQVFAVLVYPIKNWWFGDLQQEKFWKPGLTNCVSYGSYELKLQFYTAM